MSLSLSLLFYIKKSKADIIGKANIYLRITYNGKRAECSLRRKVLIKDWNAKTQKVNGKSDEAQLINNEISRAREKIYTIQQHLQRLEKPYTAIDLRDGFQEKDKTQKMLLEIFQEHNDKVESLVGKDFAAGTAERYRTCKKHIADFIKQKYKKNDIINYFRVSLFLIHLSIQLVQFFDFTFFVIVISED